MAESPKSVIEQFAILKGMTLRTGVVHEAQVFQLNCWGHIIVDDMCPNWKCFISPNKFAHPTEDMTPMTSFSGGLVRFSLAEDVALTDQSVTNLKTLQTWIRELLGPDWFLKIETPSGDIF